MNKKQILQEINTSLAQLASAAKAIIEKPASDESIKKYTNLGKENAYYWDTDTKELLAVAKVSQIPLHLLYGIDDVAKQLEQNSLQFARGHGANNALLWGARGMGKSSLVKALHGDISTRADKDLKRLVLVEISREDINSLPVLMRILGNLPAQFIIFCDDLSFEPGEASYKSLKTILDGGLEGRPQNTLFYATSNRRHLMHRDMIDNEKSSAINPAEAVHEKISLSDRFGLWLGFHNCSQEEYLNMVQGYIDYYKIKISPKELRSKALEWALTRGARSGRVAIQFVRQIAGQQGKSI
ncbi:MAG: ATP-binding protein [Devosiaceae bacterium]|nr:ATP-binding protein [Devosiaceae bacterium]